MTSFVLTPLTATLGVRVTGVDMAALAGPDPHGETVAALRDLVLRHKVVLLPDQVLDADGHVAVARRFGDVTPGSAVFPGMDPAHPEIRVFDSRRWLGRQDMWHTDMPYMPTPTSLSVLYVRIGSPGSGPLRWASTEAAYDRLDERTRRRIRDLRAVHHTPDLDRFVRAFGPGEWDGPPVTEVRPVDHPVVRRHPETGRLGLYVNPWSTRSVVGLDARAGTRLLERLFSVLTAPAYQCVVSPEPGSLLLTDTRATLHHADHVDGALRIVHRVSVAGTRPVGPDGGAP
ncbi:TauD/TfdA dioxygenase family protein [Pseudonocardia endophytica]|uniref:Taurine dioxygenase n=1 Tax=Pseudonocardia endophytica TaxID=401976 RepID=A0A4V2PIX6_PSEEN|nr:TauD/TfdA family dioxygenase [Pseudonocardia endophytica]TCK26326.1 taurine dioxygenase [Pseudonocardia endophytica]